MKSACSFVSSGSFRLRRQPRKPGATGRGPCRWDWPFRSARRALRLTALALFAVGADPGSAFAAADATAADPATRYQTACAVCHGPTGRYDPTVPGVKALDPKPADFSDPLFNSREPSGDWFMVTKHGGSPMGFSPSMPSYAGAFSDDDIDALVAHLKTLAGKHNYPPGDLNYLRPFRVKKAWLEDEVVYMNRFTAGDGDDVIWNALELEKRFLARWQAELKIAHEFEGGDEAWDEFEMGVKYALFDSLPMQLLLSGGLDWAFPLKGGDTSSEAIPYLAVGKGLGDHFSLQASVKTHVPVEEADEGDVEIALALHWMPSPWPRSLNPAVELVAKTPFESGDRDAVQWTVLPELNVGLSRRGHVRAAAGVEFPLNERTYDWRFQFYLLWDFADGPFWAGWTRGHAKPVSEYE